MITVRYFARIQEVLGKEEDHYPFDSLTVAELFERAKSQYPVFPYDDEHALLFAVNERYAKLEDVVRTGDIVAFIPPVSGG